MKRGLFIKIDCWIALGFDQTLQERHEQTKLLFFPPDVAHFVRPWHAKAFERNFTSSPAERSQFRNIQLEKMTSLAKELEQNEVAMKSKLAPHISKALTVKKPNLFRALLHEIGIEAMADSSNLVGESFSAALFLDNPNCATIT